MASKISLIWQLVVVLMAILSCSVAARHRVSTPQTAYKDAVGIKSIKKVFKPVPKKDKPRGGNY
ncbi:hypothetical protein Csa_015279 [Cucumis sativus]|uniref:Uncharacterized protein n=1 Tax=Cucumis sativus TaxID=3659 RepID=A0A0A0KW87_CUCSA|nr:hypothetical protein Csa_015279 [Cucumis sativus]